MKLVLSLFMLLTVARHASSQTKEDVAAVLDKISTLDDSKRILDNFRKQITGYDKKSLPVLAGFFQDTSMTSVYSHCLSRKLTKGELAIIVADLTETMPYAQVTQVQNCTLTFCDKNPNLIEYYLDYIAKDVAGFTKRYTAWINSKEGRKHNPIIKTENINTARLKQQ